MTAGIHGMLLSPSIKAGRRRLISRTNIDAFLTGDAA
jgi:hypothetical protein